MTVETNEEVCVSFVHGFHDHVQVDHHAPRPALWTTQADHERIHSYLFPVDSRDFDRLPYRLLGERPLREKTVAKRPRYGLTGLQRVGDYLFAGAWNGIYKLDAATKQVVSFITNRYTCYLHRFFVDHERIIFSMPFKDMVVVIDHEGGLLERFSVDCDLTVHRYDSDVNVDWRFVQKPWSGTAGIYHFNNVQVIDGKIVLLSRHLGAFVVVDPRSDRARLRTIRYLTPTCVHDGDYVNGKHYLTSIDGKIIVASDPGDYDQSVFNYDLQSECVRLGAGEKNWCRGIAVTQDHVYVTIDGRYDTELSFGLLQLDRAYKLLEERRFPGTKVGREQDIRYVAGFDILVNE